MVLHTHLHADHVGWDTRLEDGRFDGIDGKPNSLRSRSIVRKANRMFKLGSTTIEKVVDMNLNGMTLQKLLPALDDKVLGRHPERLPEGTVDADGHALLSIHSWLVRHQGLTMLIGACAGNDKARPQQPELDHLSKPFLERLAAAGRRPKMWTWSCTRKSTPITSVGTPGWRTGAGFRPSPMPR